MLFFFFFNDTATTEIYTLSLHDALPIFAGQLTMTDSLGWIVTLRARAPVTVTPSALSVTFTAASLFVALRTRVRSSSASPTRSARGNAGRRRSGCVERRPVGPSPTNAS